MLLFLIGCIFWKNNIGWQTQPQHKELQLSSSIRYFHLFGPSAKLHLAPTPTYISLGLEASPTLVFSKIISPEDIRHRFLKEMFFLSAIGIDLGGFHFSSQKRNLSILSPYVQIHTPSFCPIRKRRTMLCLTAFGEAQHHVILGEKNKTTLNTGLSIHFGKGLFPY